MVRPSGYGLCKAYIESASYQYLASHFYDALMSNPQHQAAYAMPALSGGARGEASR